MKNICLFVEYVDHNNQLTYAVSFTGVMTRRFIYAKRTSCSAPDDPEFIKVRKDKTTDCSKSVRSVIKTHFRSMQVIEELGLKDPQIIQNPTMEAKILEGIDAAIKEENRQWNDFHAA